IGVDNLVGQLTAWNYYQTIDSPANKDFVQAFKEKYGQNRVTSDPMEAAYTSMFLWKAMVEKAKSFKTDDIRSAAGGVSYEAPEGTVTVNGENHHIAKTALIGKVAPDGLIYPVGSSGAPIQPDPFLKTYNWAKSLTG
ncbi:MAG: transporter substrate-binding protein, partial [Pseudonocardiaceae bacterium]